ETRLRKGKLAIGDREHENLEPGHIEADQEYIYLLI
ncbi:MAG: hypothetical protein K0R28_732, partial [Paenibacillus sp.]|nr:hypothetical protein [Paenibacillus sp.]